jgi:hypothetical protein
MVLHLILRDDRLLPMSEYATMRDDARMRDNTRGGIDRRLSQGESCLRLTSTKSSNLLSTTNNNTEAQQQYPTRSCGRIVECHRHWLGFDEAMHGTMFGL